MMSQRLCDVGIARNVAFEPCWRLSGRHIRVERMWRVKRVMSKKSAGKSCNKGVSGGSGSSVACL